MRSLMTCPPTSPVAPFGRDFERIFDHIFTDSGSSARGPAADIVERDDHYQVQVDLPGVKKEDIQVTIEDGHLLIRARREIEKTDEKDSVLRHERRSGEFARTFRLGDHISTEGIAAQYRDGVLEVRIPKSEAAKPRMVDVQ